MRSLPMVLVALVVGVSAAMLWRKPVPRHEFMLELCKRLAEGAPHEVRADATLTRAQGAFFH